MSSMLKNFKLFVAACLLFIIAPSDSCELALNSENAAAVHPPVSGGYSTYSCIPCKTGAYEVHVINIYEPAGTNRGFQETIDYAPIPLQIKSNKDVDVKLVLISYETADWEITKSSNVNILEVLVASYNYRYSSARLKGSSSIKVQKERKYFSGWKQICEVNDYVTGKFGHISTFTAAYEVSSWNLTVGTCDNLKITTVNPDFLSYQMCLEQPDCWFKYPFIYDDTWNDCHGDQYVTMYKQYYVGVILCSNAKYKIFLSESLSGKFLNIGDKSLDYGKNHCEFIGAATERTADHFITGRTAPNVTGYYRSAWGGPIQKGLIGGTYWPQSGIYYVQHYKCGVCIPGSRMVVDYKNTDITPVTEQVTTTPKTMDTCPYNCWLKYRFKYDDSWNSCHGEQFVTTYKNYYVGVVLCSSTGTRYKLFLSESLSDRFLNIADGSGHGQDHCELIGATSEDRVQLPNDFWNSPSTQGYYRSNWGETIRKGQIGGAPSTNEWTGKYFVKWYECGLKIPGSKQVINYDDTVIFTPEARTTTSQTWENKPTYPVITSDKASSVNIAAIVGIVVGVIVGIVVIIGVTVCVVVLITKKRFKPEQVQTNPSWNGNQNAVYSSAQPGQVSWQQHQNATIPSQPLGQNLPNPQQMNQESAVPVQHFSGPPPNYYQALQVSKPVNGEQLPPMYESLQPESVRYSGQEGIYLEITDSK